MNLIIEKSNSVGIIASFVCLIHCIATPFIFIAKICTSTCCDSAPTWWVSLDYVFLVVSLIAVYQSSRSSNNRFIVIPLWFSWLILLFVLLNEQIKLVSLFDYAVYIPTISLIILHIYNMRYCKCNSSKCCVSNK